MRFLPIRRIRSPARMPARRAASIDAERATPSASLPGLKGVTATEAEAAAMASVKALQREIAEVQTKIERMQKGAELANGELAPNRRVGFSIPGNQDGLNQVDGIIDASIMADEQWALYDAAIRWLDPPTAAMISSSAAFSAICFSPCGRQQS
mgnify:CR=1 FL=1